MDSPQLLFGITAINLMLMTSTWIGSRGLPRDDPKVIRAQSFELVDTRGEVRLQLHLGEDGSGNLRIRDGNGKVRVKLGTSAAGSTGLLLMDQSVDPTLSLVAGESGTSITLLGADGKRRVITP
ncbi:MAG TPA: hypothetical protein VNO19_15055 [Gemmatimonadales bacterium]|nr:hypothetical protein [Gemmatimonadales bacterium]